jgi:pilus assembly protein CpaB
VAEELGPSVEVLVAARDLRADARVTPDAIAVRRVPARFLPPDAVVSGAGEAAGLVGARVGVPVAAGSYLNAGLFEGGEGGGKGELVRRGERVVTVGVAGGNALGELVSGTRVDVLVSTEPGVGGGRTTMALAGAELVRLGGPAGGASPEGGYPAGGAYPGDAEGRASDAASPAALATLRVSLRQAIYLTAADNFAGEIRLLQRPPGDPSRAGGTITQSQL